MRDLLFDQTLRERFAKQGVQALSAFELTEEEKNDFLTIRVKALNVDAGMRVFMLLSQMANELPVSVVIMSAFDGGIAKLKQMVDVELVETPFYERSALLGTRIRDWLVEQTLEDQKLLAMLLAYVGAEIAVNWSRAGLQKAVMNNEYAAAGNSEIESDWKQKPITLVQYVSAVIVPKSYSEIKNALCRDCGDQVWSTVSKRPVALSILSQLLSEEDPRLVVTRALISQQDVIDPSVAVQTIELSEGFSSLLQYVNGQHSTDFILQQLKTAGAPDEMLQGVEEGFFELIRSGIASLS